MKQRVRGDSDINMILGGGSAFVGTDHLREAAKDRMGTQSASRK